MSGTKSGTSTCFGSNVKKRKNTDIFSSQATSLTVATAVDKKRSKKMGKETQLVGSKRMPEAPICKYKHEYWFFLTALTCPNLTFLYRTIGIFVSHPFLGSKRPHQQDHAQK